MFSVRISGSYCTSHVSLLFVHSLIHSFIHQTVVYSPTSYHVPGTILGSVHLVANKRYSLSAWSFHSGGDGWERINKYTFWVPLMSLLWFMIYDLFIYLSLWFIPHNNQVTYMLSLVLFFFFIRMETPRYPVICHAINSLETYLGFKPTPGTLTLKSMLLSKPPYPLHYKVFSME